MKATFFEVQTYDESKPESMAFFYTPFKREAMKIWNEREENSPGLQRLCEVTITAKTVQDLAILAAYVGSLAADCSVKHQDYEIDRKVVQEDE